MNTIEKSVRDFYGKPILRFKIEFPEETTDQILKMFPILWAISQREDSFLSTPLDFLETSKKRDSTYLAFRDKAAELLVGYELKPTKEEIEKKAFSRLVGKGEVKINFETFQVVYFPGRSV